MKKSVTGAVNAYLTVPKEQLRSLTEKQSCYKSNRRKEDLEIAMSMTGVGFTSASTILAEIGNISKERKEKSHRCIGKKSSLHIASSPGEQRKIPGQ